MTQTTPQPANDAAPELVAAPSDVWVQRVGPRRYTGHNDRGAQVEIGDATAHPGTFTPGELLRAALGACAGFSADAPIVRRLGEDATVTIRIDAIRNLTDDRFESFAEDFAIDLSAIDADDATKLIAIIQRAVAANCTVEHTLAAGAPVTLDVHGTVTGP